MMGILVFYEGDGRIAGDIRRRHWRQMRRVLPLLFDWLNEHMRRPPSNTPPKLVVGQFKLAAMMRDDSGKTEEINLIDLAEWKRFFGWCDFLAPLDDSFGFFAPVVQVLREQSRHPDEVRQG
jgi:hypothetical protein